jgi:hypothetical protein
LPSFCDQDVLCWCRDALISLPSKRSPALRGSAIPIDAIIAALDAAATVFRPERRA